MSDKDEEVQCTSRWTKVGSKSWKGFVYLNQSESENDSETHNDSTSTYSWYHPYYWIY